MQNCKSVIFIILILNLVGCKKNPCDGLDNGVYVYPEVKGKSLSEATELYKIPESVLECISTQGLIESCIYYPEIRMIWTHYHLQGGFDKVEAMCNGFEELWKREDKYTELMALYKGLNFERDWEAYTDLEHGRFMDNIVRHELILAQNEILFDLTESQKIELFEFSLQIQKSKFEKVEYYGSVGMATTLAILSRIMYHDQYQPLIEEYNNYDPMQYNVNFIITADKDVVGKIMNLSEEYLIQIKK